MVVQTVEGKILETSSTNVLLAVNCDQYKTGASKSAATQGRFRKYFRVVVDCGLGE